PELDRKVAVKLVRPSVLASEKESSARERLMREAQTMAQLSHPNVVAVHDVGEVDGQVFLAMDYIEGETLLRWCRRGPSLQWRPWPEILEMFIQAGRGLAAAHRSGIVHRDFKPENVLVDADGRARVLDFGLAASRRRPLEGPLVDSLSSTSSGAGSSSSTHSLRDSRITPEGMLTGTPAYMSPEQHLGHETDAQSDQFSFCVALHEGLYRVRPFLGRTLKEFRAAVLRNKIVDPPSETKVPTWVRRAILRGLSIHVEDRFPSMDALLAALDPAPRRARRRRWVAAGVGAVIVAGALGYREYLVRDYQRQLAAAAEVDHCADVGEPIEAIWGPQPRAQVRAALIGTKLAYAGDVAKRVEQRFDEFAGEWSAMRIEACRATRVDGTQSEELLDLRMACLDRRATSFAALVEVLSAADGTVVENAIQAASNLPRLGTCADTSGLLARVAPPEDEADVREVEAVRRELTEASARNDAGRHGEALERTDAALVPARRLDYRPLLGESMLLRGEILDSLGEYERAADSLREAYWHALASRDDRVSSRAASLLVHVEGERGVPEQALRWSRHAEAIIDRLAADGATIVGEWRAGLANHVAGVYARTGKYDEALDGYLHALDGMIAARGRRDLPVAGIYNNIGNLLVRRGQSARAIEHFHAALEIYEAALGAQHPLVAVALSNLGDAYRAERALAEAKEYTRRAATIFEATLSPDHPNLGTVYNNLCEIEYMAGELESAEARCRQALAIIERALGETSIYTAYPRTALGEVLLARGQPAEARDALQPALALRGGEGVSPEERGRTRLALARAQWELGGRAEQRAALEMAQEAYRELVQGGVGAREHREQAATWLEERGGAVDAAAAAGGDGAHATAPAAEDARRSPAG
ncbi:MAG: serine/threonine protein kinase, partial [Myxococcales bacterium]|nr:serine/threonine protein kinase [Myxococcales bacterium]